METITKTKVKTVVVSPVSRENIRIILKKFNYDVLNVKKISNEIIGEQTSPDIILLDDEFSENWKEDWQFIKQTSLLNFIPVIVIVNRQLDFISHKNYLEDGIFGIVHKEDLNQLSFLCISGVEQGRKIKEEKLKQKELNRILSTSYLELDAQINYLELTKKKLDKIVNNIHHTSNNGLSNLVLELEKKLKKEGYYQLFKIHFEQAHPAFYKNLLSLNNTLTTNNLKLLTFLKMGFNNTEIALLLNVTLAAVKKSIQRLKPKLNIDKDNSIREFLIEV